MNVDKARAQLDELALRIERLSTSPEAIKAPLVRLIRPLLARLGWQAPVVIDRASELIEMIGESARGDEKITDAVLEKQLGAAIAELAANVNAVERATALEGRVHFSQAVWLRRVYELLRGATDAVQVGVTLELDLIGGADPVELLAPLMVRSGAEATPDRGADDVDIAATKLLSLQVGSVDRLLDAAREETDMLGRRRRLLEAARRVLVETSAALPLDPRGVEARMRHISQEVTRLDRLQAAGVSPEIALLHQAQSAQARGERDKLYATLRAIERHAIARRDRAVAQHTARALEKMCGEFDAHALPSVASSIERSSREVFGDAIVDAVRRGHAGVGPDLGDPEQMTPVQRAFYQVRLEAMSLGVERSTLAAAMSVDGCFDLGGVMSPVRVSERELYVEAVPFPTPDLTFVHAQGPEDVPNALIEDPRTILMSLAAGRLLTRRYIREEVREKQKTVMRGEARVYVLDGSGSMLGPRAVMRDAILIAELATLVRRSAEAKRNTRLVVFFRYFDEQVGETTRIDTPKQALDAITRILEAKRTGGTDLHAAIMASLKEVREAKEKDRDLARAQIVLVTDGEAEVSELAINRAREEIDPSVSLGVSIIAVGQENAALRRLVARQRARGERAFYQFISDAALEAISKGGIDRGPALHLPPLPQRDRPLEPLELAEELEQQVGELLGELAAIQRTRDQATLAATASSESERARAEAILGDDRRLEHRFQRWFPEVGTLEPRMPEKGTIEHADAELVQAVLATIAEVIALVEGSERARRRDAVDLLERLLPDARLSPARYEAIVRDHPAAVARGLAAVHASVRWGIVKSIRK